MSNEGWTALPASDDSRGGAEHERHRATLAAATLQGDDPWVREERARVEEERRRLEAAEAEQRYVAALDACSVAELGQARSDAMKSAATVSTVGIAGFLVGGPIGAVVGIGVGWLFDKFNEPLLGDER